MIKPTSTLSHQIKYNSHKFSKYFKVLVALAIVTFGATIWILSSSLEYLTDVVSFDLDSKEFKSPLKTVELINKFDREISIHYDDNEVGLYLSNLKQNEKLMVSAAVGQGLYATEVNGWERLDFISIRSDVKTYTFSPHGLNALKFRQINVQRRSRQHPQVVKLHGGSRALSTRFRSFTSKTVELWFDDGKGGINQGRLHTGQETTTNSYPGHQFFVTEAGKKENVITRFHIIPSQVVYYVLDDKFPATDELMNEYYYEKRFMSEYYNKTGIHWRHYIGPHGPRPPPTFYMWPAKEVGDVHVIHSEQGFWSCIEAKEKCQSKDPLKFELEVVSIKPRVFYIENFLNMFEADAIMQMSKPKLHHSSVGDVEVGAFESDTRTSDNTWITRDSSILIDSLYRRAADVLQIEETNLHRGKSVEDIQVVHYVNGQHYDAHHDWGVSGYPESRYLTLLIYLTDMVGPNAGGETSFPKGLDGDGFKVKPKKGNAVLFYNLLEDGNGDDLSLHAALPVREGEKWLANFWVWDPRVRG